MKTPPFALQRMGHPRNNPLLRAKRVFVVEHLVFYVKPWDKRHEGENVASELDANNLIRTIVRTLLSRPAEWLTFNFAARLAGMDRDLLAALAETRTDLFAINDDRRLKLRPGVVEQISQVGIAKWQVPARPERTELSVWHARPSSGSDSVKGLCYCALPEDSILDDLLRGSIPEDALVRTCCWKQVCRVRGHNYNSVDPETWREICQFRGYILGRENPRGF